MALGPLTNLALCAKLDKDIASRINKVVIMGGAWLNQGNSSLSAEFNFFMDPDSANIVLRHYANVHLLPIETAVKIFYDEKESDELRGVKTKTGEFYKKITDFMLKDYSGKIIPLADSMCDAVAATCAFYPESVKKIEEMETYVDIKGEKTRGSLVSIWYGTGTYFDDILKKPELIKKVKIITDACKVKCHSSLLEALNGHR